MANDLTAPTITAASVGLDTTKSYHQLSVTFSKAVNTADAQNPANFVLKDSDGNIIPLGHASCDATTNTVTFNTENSSGSNVKINGGTYSLSVSGITDTTPNLNKLAPYTTSINVADVILPSISNATYNSNKIVVTYSKAMGASATNLNNYIIATTGGNVTLSAANGDTITQSADGKSVTITVSATSLNGNAFASGNIEVGNVLDTAGNPINTGAFFAQKALTPDVLTVVSAEAISTKQAQVVFSQPVSAAVAGDFTFTNAGGAVAEPVSIASITTNTDGQGVVTLNLGNALDASGELGSSAVTVHVGITGTKDALGTTVTSMTSAAVKDGIAPTVTSAVVNSTGTAIALTFSKALSSSTLSTGSAALNGFTVAGGTLDSALRSGSTTVVLTGTGFSTGTTVAYNSAAGVQDTDTNALASFSGQAVASSTAPAAPVISGVTNGAVVNTSVTPTFSAAPTGGSQTYTLNGKAYTAGTAITTEGNYTLVATATDAVGNTTSTTASFTIDKARDKNRRQLATVVEVLRSSLPHTMSHMEIRNLSH